jgi:hypothetical protein
VGDLYDELAARPLDAAGVAGWLGDWSSLSRLLYEMQARLAVQTTVNTADPEADRLYKRYLDEISPHVQEAEQRLRLKLLASGLAPAGFELPLRRMASDRLGGWCLRNLGRRERRGQSSPQRIQYDLNVSPEADGIEERAQRAELLFQ